LKRVFSRPFAVEGEEEALKGTERDLRIHAGTEIQIFTISILAGIKNGTLFNFKPLLGDGQEIQLLFRVRIAE
jgi:hypothetical protein